MRTTTIRVPIETRDRLNALAEKRGESAGELVATLAREADDQALLDAAEESWEGLSRNPASLSAYRAEAAELEAFGARLPEY